MFISLASETAAHSGGFSALTVGQPSGGRQPTARRETFIVPTALHNRMNVRDAVEADADRLAALTDSPTDVMRNLIHDRTVRVADADGDVEGFVSYDAESATVHVTQLEGDAELCETLLAEPTRFAAREDMTVELLAMEADNATQAAAERAAFERCGSGPRFGGTPTIRYRWEPESEAGPETGTTA